MTKNIDLFHDILIFLDVPVAVIVHMVSVTAGLQTLGPAFNKKRSLLGGSI